MSLSNPVLKNELDVDTTKNTLELLRNTTDIFSDWTKSEILNLVDFVKIFSFSKYHCSINKKKFNKNLKYILNLFILICHEYNNQILFLEMFILPEKMNK